MACFPYITTKTTYIGTGNMNKSFWQAHGESSVTARENIITTRVAGAFNEYGVTECNLKSKKLIKEHDDNGFYLLVNMLDVEGGTPEAYQELQRHNVWLNSQRLIAKAVVIRTPFIRVIINANVPALAKQNIKEFYNEKDALDWLKSAA
jgi:hypothetical protein